MIQSGGFVNKFLGAFFDPVKTIKEIINKADKLSKKNVSLNHISEKVNFAKDVLWASTKTFGAGISLNNNEIKDIMKVIKALENRGILLRGTTRKISSQRGGVLNFLRLL